MKREKRVPMSSQIQTRSAKRFSALLVVCFLSGCYERITKGDQSIYHFAKWVGPLVILGGIVALPLAWFIYQGSKRFDHVSIRQWGARFALVLAVVGPVALALVAPGMYMDRVVVDADHFEASYGMWFKPSLHTVRFDDLSEIRFATVPGPRGRKVRQLHCKEKTGTTHVVAVGDLLINAVPEILEKARTKGVSVFQDAP
jgi:hypothetical protein